MPSIAEPVLIDKPVPNEIIDDLIETALSSPSASNTQPYRLAIATGDIRDALAEDLTRIFDKANSIPTYTGRCEADLPTNEPLLFISRVVGMSGR